MNTKNHPFLYVAGSEGQEEKKKADPQKSPYLKAILSGTAGSAVVRKILSAVGSDKAAAIRYIKESACLRKV
jgi:hypothetical protein